jgi:hypothetical protein
LIFGLELSKFDTLNSAFANASVRREAWKTALTFPISISSPPEIVEDLQAALAQFAELLLI